MNVIIFSKDRAAQLDLLLCSLPNGLKTVSVIWTASNDRFEAGYRMLIGQYTGRALFVKEGRDFKKDVIWCADAHWEYTVFFTDDDVFVHPLPKSVALSSDVLCLSLRLNPTMNYCYTLNRVQSKPEFMLQCQEGERRFMWGWKGADADYGYPMSLDGHIFRTDDILPLLRGLSYYDPNSLEGQLARHPINRPRMACFEHSIIINNPINRVQDTALNRHGDITAEYLNDMFLSGKRIAPDPFKEYNPKSCHVELPIEWV